MERSLPARQTQWSDHRIKQAYKLALLGATDAQMADVMGVNVNTLAEWKRTQPGFYDAIMRGKMEADAEVAHSLYKNARGYDYEEERAFVIDGRIVKTTVKKHRVADSWAASKWLATRQRGLWTEIQKVETTQTNINISKVNFLDFSMEEMKLLRKMQLQQMATDVGDN